MFGSQILLLGRLSYHLVLKQLVPRTSASMTWVMKPRRVASVVFKQLVPRTSASMTWAMKPLMLLYTGALQREDVLEEPIPSRYKDHLIPRPVAPVVQLVNSKPSDVGT